VNQPIPNFLRVSTDALNEARTPGGRGINQQANAAALDHAGRFSEGEAGKLPVIESEPVGNTIRRIQSHTVDSTVSRLNSAELLVKISLGAERL
jgi:hypothetical protein